MSEPERFGSGRYELLGLLGGGSQAETFEAKDTTDEKRVALKRFSVRGAKSWKDVELAERETRVLSQLSHSHLPRYLDAFEENGALFLVMEKVEGESLASIRKRGGTLGPGEITRLLEEMGELFEYLHGRAPPVIHRDVKPGNVIRRPDGSFALVDFGSVRDSLKPEGGSTVVGTFGYMAPEQFQGRALPQSDVYALGATALALASGKEPEDLPHRGLAIDVGAVLPHDRALARVLGRMLDPDPDRRPARVRPLLAELRPRREPPKARPHADDRRDERRDAAVERPHWFPPTPGIFLLVLIGLAIARVSTALLFRVFLPVVLTLLSIFFGGGLRRAAERLRQLGQDGDRGLRQARDALRGEQRARRRRRRERYRVIDTEGEALDDEREREREWDDDRDARRDARRQRRH